MAKVTSSVNKEKSTNSYAADNRAAIKKLASSAGEVISKSNPVGLAISATVKAVKKVKQHLDKKKAQKDMEAIDVQIMSDEKKNIGKPFDEDYTPYEEDKVIEIDEMQDVLKSLGAFDKQVKKEKESGTNTYAKDNQKTIKKLKA